MTRHEIGKLLRHCRSILNLPEAAAITELNLPTLVSGVDLNNFTCLLALELLFATGVRVGELVAVAPADVDLNNGTILINGKGNRQRLVFVTDPEIIILLLANKEISARHAKNATKLLLNSRGGNVTTATVRKLLHSAAEAAASSAASRPT